MERKGKQISFRVRHCIGSTVACQCCVSGNTNEDKGAAAKCGVDWPAATVKRANPQRSVRPALKRYTRIHYHHRLLRHTGRPHTHTHSNIQPHTSTYTKLHTKIYTIHPRDAMLALCGLDCLSQVGVLSK